ncbi:MAG: hypothetical protein VB876_13135, partial [Pirellulales bacterium]
MKPAEVAFDHPDSSAQLLVSAVSSDNRVVDRTHEVQFRSLDPAVAVVNSRGVVMPRGDGQTQIVVVDGGDRVAVPVRVEGYASPRRVSFRDEVL